jgi:PTS system mannitol-specific IIA component
MDKLILNEDNILLGIESESKDKAIERAGNLLVKNGYVKEEYIEGMKKRESDVSSYIGNGIAIPHGMPEYKKYITRSGIVVVQYPKGVDFGDGNTAYIVVGIAGRNDEHVGILSSIAIVCQYQENVNKLRCASTKEEILNILLEGER